MDIDISLSLTAPLHRRWIFFLADRVNASFDDEVDWKFFFIISSLSSCSCSNWNPSSSDWWAWAMVDVSIDREMSKMEGKLLLVRWHSRANDIKLPRSTYWRVKRDEPRESRKWLDLFDHLQYLIPNENSVFHKMCRMLKSRLRYQADMMMWKTTVAVDDGERVELLSARMSQVSWRDNKEVSVRAAGELWRHLHMWFISEIQSFNRLVALSARWRGFQICHFNSFSWNWRVDVSLAEVSSKFSSNFRANRLLFRRFFLRISTRGSRTKKKPCHNCCE